jgi:hypothetical protein
MNHKSWTEERQIIQWSNEPQVMNRIKTDNTMAKWTTSFLFMTCGSFGHCIICLSSIHDLWFICPLYYLSLFYSWLVVHLAIVLSVFLLFMTCGSFDHCIICFSSIYDLWFMWPLYYLYFFYSWLVVHLAIALSVFRLFVACGSFGQIMQWSNEPQVMNRRKTDNTMAKWTTSHE